MLMEPPLFNNRMGKEELEGELSAMGLRKFSLSFHRSVEEIYGLDKEVEVQAPF